MGARAEQTALPRIDLAPRRTTDDTSSHLTAREADGPAAPGKRRATKPTRADRSAARNTERHEARASAAREAAESRAAREALRQAERQAEQEAARAAAVRKAETQAARADSQRAGHGSHTGGRKSLFPALPSAPTLVGAAALAFAAVGATVSQQNAPVPGEFQKFASQASVLNAATSIGSSDAVNGRQRAVSRDSDRKALKDAADAELLAAAEDQAKERDAALAALAASAQKHAKVLARNAWDFALPAGSYRVSYNYGQCSYLWANCHTGEDFSAPYGTTIYNIASGVVTSAGYDGSYGNKTVVTLEDGTELWYCHQSSMNVSVGQTVEPGQAIGAVGTTGNTTGPHLHLEVRPGGGDPVSPLSTLAVHGVNP